MRTWETERVYVYGVPHDHDLHAFEVHNKEGELLGSIYPWDTVPMQNLIADLDAGGCPIADGWEDGRGNVCDINGWGDE